MARPEPMDEKVWGDPGVLSMHGGGPFRNNILHYFGDSIFADRTSNNSLIRDQAERNPAMLETIATLENFHSALAGMQGLQYVLVHGPSERPGEKKKDKDKNKGKENGKGTKSAKEVANAAEGEEEPVPLDHGGAWVIRKQYVSNGEVTPLASYFVIGYLIYQAPSLLNILSGKMLSTYKCLSDSMELAHTLPLFSASHGHYYRSDSQQGRTAPSRTAQASKEETPMPDNASTVTGNASKIKTNALGQGLLMESLSLALRYKDEYMDENPLVGEPGQFVMRKSRTDNTLVKPSQVVKSATPLPPPPIETNVQSPLSKGVKGGDKSPTTPGGTKKRKRSKAATATTTPK